MDPCTCMAEPLCCFPENYHNTVDWLYPNTNCFCCLKKKKSMGIWDGEWMGTPDGEMNGHFQGHFHFPLDPFTPQSSGPVGLWHWVLGHECSCGGGRGRGQGFCHVTQPGLQAFKTDQPSKGLSVSFTDFSWVNKAYSRLTGGFLELSMGTCLLATVSVNVFFGWCLFAFNLTPESNFPRM